MADAVQCKALHYIVNQPSGHMTAESLQPRKPIKVTEPYPLTEVKVVEHVRLFWYIS